MKLEIRNPQHVFAIFSIAVRSKIGKDLATFTINTYSCVKTKLDSKQWSLIGLYIPHHHIHLNKQGAFVYVWMNEYLFALTTKL